MNTEINWSNFDDTEKFKLIRERLFTAVVGDVLDASGHVLQFLPPGIKPLDDAMVVVGRAMPVLEADCFEQDIIHTGKRQPFGVMFEALDDLQPNEVYVCTGSSHNYALWGELMSLCATKSGAAGAVVDGYSRDTNGILKLGFPTFSRGTYAQDQGVRGRVIDFRCALRFSNGVSVSPGDLLFGDRDGVVVIPNTIEDDILKLAYDKVIGENKVRAAIEQGMSSREAFDTFGIM